MQWHTDFHKGLWILSNMLFFQRSSNDSLEGSIKFLSLWEILCVLINGQWTSVSCPSMQCIWAFLFVYFEFQRPKKKKVEHKTVTVCERLGWYQRLPIGLSVREAVWILPPPWFPGVKAAVALLYTWGTFYSLHCNICEIELFDENTAVK